MINRAQEIKDGKRAIGNDSPAVDGVAVVASGDDQGPYCALYIANAGTVSLRTIGGTPLTFANCPAGILSVMCDRVTACPAGTLGLW